MQYTSLAGVLHSVSLTQWFVEMCSSGRPLDRQDGGEIVRLDGLYEGIALLARFIRHPAADNFIKADALPHKEMESVWSGRFAI